MRVVYRDTHTLGQGKLAYGPLENKPTLNDIELIDDHNTEELKVTWFGTQAEYADEFISGLNPYTIYIIDDESITPMDTNSYHDIENKPSLEGTEMVDDLTLEDVQLFSQNDIEYRIKAMRSIKLVDAKPTSPEKSTLYYVGPNSEGIYWIYLYDNNLNEINMGPSKEEDYKGTRGVVLNYEQKTMGHSATYAERSKPTTAIPAFSVDAYGHVNRPAYNITFETTTPDLKIASNELRHTAAPATTQSSTSNLQVTTINKGHITKGEKANFTKGLTIKDVSGVKTITHTNSITAKTYGDLNNQVNGLGWDDQGHLKTIGNVVQVPCVTGEYQGWNRFGYFHIPWGAGRVGFKTILDYGPIVFRVVGDGTVNNGAGQAMIMSNDQTYHTGYKHYRVLRSDYQVNYDVWYYNKAAGTWTKTRANRAAGTWTDTTLSIYLNNTGSAINYKVGDWWVVCKAGELG